MVTKVEAVDKKRKRSSGVTFFAWSFIIACLVGLLTVPGMPKTYPFLSQSVLTGVIIYALITSIAGVVAGINLLRLKEWARRLVVVLVILNFFEMIFFTPLNHRYAEIAAQDPKTAEIFAKQYDNLPAETRTRIPFSKDEFIRHAQKMSVKWVNFMIGALEALLAVYLFAVLWFFTKLNIRKQFS